MSDEENPYLIAFNALSKKETIKVLQEKQKKPFCKSLKDIAWEVDTEIYIKGKALPIILILVLDGDFPYSLPRVFLDPTLSNRIGAIPHINEDYFICTFDEEIISINQSDPAGIVSESLQRAKTIVCDGIKGENAEDFIGEFIAYWERKYNKEQLPISVLSLINGLEEGQTPKLICFDRYFASFKYALYVDNDVSQSFKDFLDNFKISYTEVDVYYLKNIPIKDKPPFNTSNKESVTLLETTSGFQDFKRFINGYDNPKLVLTTKKLKDKDVLIGWFYNPLQTNRNGFRPGKFKPYDALTKTQSSDYVWRFVTDTFTSERIRKRSSGEIDQVNSYSFCMAGLGSIGSNLFYYLNAYDNSSFCFIDPDFLLIENIGRHFLGFDYIGKNKATAMRDFALLKNPIQNIDSKDLSIIEVLKTEPKIVNGADYLFSAIGNQNVESWIGNALESGVLAVPTFFIWVEPYLSGGHLLFIHPKQPSFLRFFDDGLFKFNIISSSDYERNAPGLSLHESGCQTTYIPYSSMNVQSFISAIYPTINEIIINKNEVSQSFSWKGDTRKLAELEISVSENSLEYKAGEIIENNL